MTRTAISRVMVGLALATLTGCAEGGAGSIGPGLVVGADIPVDWFGRFRSAIGLGLMIGVAYLMSNARQRVRWRLVAAGLALQIVLGFATLSGPGRVVFGAVNVGVQRLLSYTEEGAAFLFGDLARYNSLPVGSSVIPPPTAKDSAVEGAGERAKQAWLDRATRSWLERAKRSPTVAPEKGPWRFVSVGAYVAFGVLPTIIFFSALMSVLYHVGLMQQLVRGLAWLMQRTMHTSGAETLSAAGNIFVGQTEAPLLVRPFVKDMTMSELMAVMTGGFATVAGGVMVAFVAILQPVFPDIAGHLLCASIMSAPAALVVAKIIVPEPDPTKSTTYGKLKIVLPKTDANVIDAAARGAGEGLRLALNVGAMLLAFIALIALANGIVGAVGSLVTPWFGVTEPITLQLLLGLALKPVAWCMGVTWADAGLIGSLLGIKTVLNEFYAYVLLSEQASTLVSTRSLVICTYALCGFANFSSIAIQLGGLSPLAPERRQDLAQLGLRAMVGGTLAAFMTACVIGMMI